MALQQKQLDEWCSRDVSSPPVEMTSEGVRSHGYDHDHGGPMEDRPVEVRTSFSGISYLLSILL